MKCDRCAAVISSDRATDDVVDSPTQVWQVTIHLSGHQCAVICVGCRHAILQLAINRLVERTR